MSPPSRIACASFFPKSRSCSAGVSDGSSRTVGGEVSGDDFLRGDVPAVAGPVRAEALVPAVTFPASMMQNRHDGGFSIRVHVVRTGSSRATLHRLPVGVADDVEDGALQPPAV